MSLVVPVRSGRFFPLIVRFFLARVFGVNLRHVEHAGERATTMRALEARFAGLEREDGRTTWE